MLKRLCTICFLFTSILVSACSINKDDLIKENNALLEENNTLSENIEKAKEILITYEFYNNITSENVNSFVLVESKNLLTSETLYSNGVVVASNGLDYYILTDYNSIKQSGMIRYRIMDCNAIVYTSSLANVIDEDTGLALLLVDVTGYANVNLSSIKLGDKTDLLAYFSSVKQINNIQLTDNIKTSTINYNDTSYETYYLENIEFEGGTLLINNHNELCGIYLSKIEKIISSQLVKDIVYVTYSLTL